MDWTYWFLPMQARQEAVEWEDLRRALGLPVDCWEDLGGQVALGAMWVCHKPAAKYRTPAWNLIFSFLSYFFIFSISQHLSIWCHTKNQHIDLVIQCYSSFHRVQSHGWNPITHHFIGEIRSWCWQAPWAAAPGGCGADCWGETAAGTPGSVTAPWRRSFVREVCVLSLSLYLYIY